MARLARVVVAGMAHRVTQRSNRREAVFFGEADRQWCLSDEDDAWVAMLRARTCRGRPCGSEGFVVAFQERLGRALSPGQPGPKPKRDRSPSQVLRPRNCVIVANRPFFATFAEDVHLAECGT